MSRGVAGMVDARSGDERPIRVGLIGASGHFGKALTAIAASNRAVLAGAARAHDGEPWDAVRKHPAFTQDTGEFSSPEELLDRGFLDAVIVNPPYGWNARWAIAAVERGVAVYCEKPLATTFDDLERLKAAARRSGVPLVAMYEFRTDPVVRAAARAVREGRIGAPRLAFGQKSYKFGPERRPAWYNDRSMYGGTIPWVAIHAIDWTRYIAGKEFRAVSAVQYRYGKAPLADVEAAGSIQLEGEEFAAVVTFDYLRPAGAKTHGNDRFRIVGDRGEITGSVPDRRIELCTDAGVEALPLEEGPSLFEALIDALASGSAPPMTAEDAIRSTEVALWARQAADERRRIEMPAGA